MDILLASIQGNEYPLCFLFLFLSWRTDELRRFRATLYNNQILHKPIHRKIPHSSLRRSDLHSLPLVYLSFSMISNMNNTEFPRHITFNWTYCTGIHLSHYHYQLYSFCTPRYAKTYSCTFISKYHLLSHQLYNF